MKVIVLSCLFLFGSLSLPAQTETPRDNSITPSYPGYSEAMNFAEMLSAHGIKVFAVSASVYNGFFIGIEKAAYFRTNRGIFEVIFFPDPTVAEKISVKEIQQGDRYIYLFSGQPHPRPNGDGMDSSKPMKFITNGNRFILVWGNEELYETLKEALK